MKNSIILLIFLPAFSLFSQVHHDYPGHGASLGGNKKRTLELFSYYGGTCSDKEESQLICNVKEFDYEINFSKEGLIVSYFRTVKSADLIKSYGYSNPPKSMPFINHLHGHTSIYGFPVIFNLEKQVALYNSNDTTDNYIVLIIDELGNYRFSACTKLSNCKDIYLLKKAISANTQWRCDLYSEVICSSDKFKKYLK
ncbi:hypothetical protein EHQ81_19415 [Leptospira selangorensis]|uniref:Uncharacterized protein n=2 Tax=Leptospira selangorensis TaxID=2484982 RepID=A0A5F2C6I3_9LEPT|nr:hypothetical protein EHQ81_19415 [Leptospira selangorensis]TGM27939.1 hypothetical protein EHQ82_01595 [Leptospira selangorensis]